MTLALLHDPADVVRWLLVALGTVTNPTLSPLSTWPGFHDIEPSTPDNCVTLYDTSGLIEGRTMPDGALLRHPGFQVRIRAVDSKTGRVKAEAIQKVLAETIYQNTVHVDASAYVVWCCSGIGDVIRLGKDKPTTRRNLFTINARVDLWRTA